MKKFSIFAVAMAAVAMTFTACNNEDKKGDVDFDQLPNGFYVSVAGEDLVAANAMDQGTNEVDQTARTGMYEKYVILEANKEYEFVNKKGNNADRYGVPELAYGDSLIVTENHNVAGYKGSLGANTTIKVKETALYHIVLDFDEDGKLADVGGAQCIIVPVEWGVRGGMNSWGFTLGEKSEADGAITWTWKDQELAAAGEFKFAHSEAWKIVLDIANLVKANTNLGTDCVPGGDNIKVEKAGLYTITLTYKASTESSAIKDSYTMTVTCTQESSLPTTMYIIGNDFGNWDWAADGVVEMTPVHSHAGVFWAIRHMTTDTEFKFCATKAWNGDFTKLGTNEGFITPDNDQVEADGIYTIIVDLKNDKLTVMPAEVYGMGDGFGSWDEGKYPFEADGTTLTATAAAAGNLRMYAKIPGNEGNWWQSEFNIYDGKIVYRAGGGDQEAVSVAAGAKVTLNFNEGTGEIK